ncbi:Os08g0549450, partial [Oryza sativa Japonica Group]
MSAAASSTVAIDCALDSSTLMWNSSSRPITISTVSSESAPRSENLDAPETSVPSGTASCFLTMSQTFSTYGTHGTANSKSHRHWLQAEKCISLPCAGERYRISLDCLQFMEQERADPAREEAMAGGSTKVEGGEHEARDSDWEEERGWPAR